MILILNFDGVFKLLFWNSTIVKPLYSEVFWLIDSVAMTGRTIWVSQGAESGHTHLSEVQGAQYQTFIDSET